MSARVRPFRRSFAGRLAGPSVLAAALGLILAAAAPADDVVSTRLTPSPFLWSEVSRWDHDLPGLVTFPNNGNEGHDYSVAMPNNLVILDLPITIDVLGITQGTVRLEGQTLQVLESFDAAIATIDGDSFGGSMIVSGPTIIGSNLNLVGAQVQLASLELDGNADVTLRSDAVLDVDGPIVFNGNGNLTSLDGTMPRLELDGATLRKAGGSGANDVNARITAGSFAIENQSSGGSTVTGGTQLDLRDNEAFGVVELDFGGSIGDGEIALGPAGEPSRVLAHRIVSRGRLALVAGGEIVATDGVELLDGGELAGGSGAIVAPVVENLAGTIRPGDPADAGAGIADPTGTLVLAGDFEQGVDGGIEIEITGAAPGDADRLEITGAATLGGTLRVVLLDGYEPEDGASWEILGAASIDGAFEAVDLPDGLAVAIEDDRVVVSTGDAACPSDVDGDGAVALPDLLAVLSMWGACDGCTEDIDVDGVVALGDLLALLAAWGPCP